jgi:hypothetical protein
MSLPSDINPQLLASSTGYNLTRSLRFRASASAYLSRTPASAGNRQTWTWSAWVKRGTLGTAQSLFVNENGAATNGHFNVFINTDNTINFGDTDNGATNTYNFVTTQVFRDPSAWYHLVFVLDTTNATSTNRVKMYVNGVQVTAFSAAAYPVQNYSGSMNRATATYISSLYYTAGGYYFDGYLTEVNFIDGQALTPSSFGSTNATTGVWQPARYTGTYGTNGFYLPFTDNSALTTSSNVGLGKDFSGNGNYWTTNNISLTGGTIQSFTTTGTTSWTAPAGVTQVNYLVVAGGAGGGGGTNAASGASGSGGGAGGLLQGQLTVVPGNSYTVTVGAGGAAGIATSQGGAGGNSVFSSLTAIGGGGGGAGHLYTPAPSAGFGVSGGSGGGSGGSTGTTDATFGTGTSGQGNNGGTNTANGNNSRAGNGGGGAGSVGGNSIQNTPPGAAGAGLASSITGSSLTYAVGGAGAPWNTGGTGASGAANTGNGGAGGTGDASGGAYSGGAGGSGIVIISYGAGVTYDSMTDVPTLTSATAANYAVINPLVVSSANALSNGNLTYVSSAAGNRTVTLNGSFKQYGELTIGSGNLSAFGLATSTADLTQNPGITNVGLYGIYDNSGGFFLISNGTTITSIATQTSAGVVFQLAYDAAGGKLWIGRNNVWYDSALGTTGNPSAGTNPTLSGLAANLFMFVGSGNFSTTYNCNFGQQPFQYTPPTGFVALNTYNLPTSTIIKGNTVMDATIYSGDNASPRSITNAAGFKPDLVWVKSRSNLQWNKFTDSVRGATNAFYTNDTGSNDATPLYGSISAFNSNGFSVSGGASGITDVNGSGQTYVAWQWQAGQGTNVTNTNGSITSTVSVNASAGFSIVSFTGNATQSATVGHGLGVAPTVVIYKNKITAHTWTVISQNLLGLDGYLYLNTTAAKGTGASELRASTSSVLTLPATYVDINPSGEAMLAYCFAPIAGYSAFGSYTGNGSTSGPFVYTGFQPKFILIKSTTAARDWIIWDTVRNTFNIGTAGVLFPNTSGVEYLGGGAYAVAVTSNGFYLPVSTTNLNASGETHIYAAFATVPFKNSLAF